MISCDDRLCTRRCTWTACRMNTTRPGHMWSSGSRKIRRNLLEASQVFLVACYVSLLPAATKAQDNRITVEEYREYSRKYSIICDMYALYDSTFHKWAESIGRNATDVVREAIHLANVVIMENQDWDGDGVIPDYGYGVVLRKEKYLPPSPEDERDTGDMWYRGGDVEKHLLSEIDSVLYKGCVAYIFHRHNTVPNSPYVFPTMRAYFPMRARGFMRPCVARQSTTDFPTKFGETQLVGLPLAVALARTIMFDQMWPRMPLNLRECNVNNATIYGYYILQYPFERSYDGSKPNHLNIAPCWMPNVRKYIESQNWRMSCLPRRCGNELVDLGEECDCGHHIRDAFSCSITPNDCCNKKCKLIPNAFGHNCARPSDVGCFKQRTCDGNLSSCPMTGMKGAYCDKETHLCTDDGRCEASLCLFWQATQCEDCEKDCHVCCRDSRGNCTPIETWRPSPTFKIRLWKPKGTRCGEGKSGKCDDVGRCILCGNGIVNTGEDCDCDEGELGRCLSEQPCCDYFRCRFVPMESMKLCSASSEEMECLKDRVCNGTSTYCPDSEGRLCAGGRKACTSDGRCEMSICLYLGKRQECPCRDAKDECKVCCWESDDVCSPSDNFLISDDQRRQVKTHKENGTLCGRENKRRGWCDEVQGLCHFFSSGSTTCGNGVIEPSRGEECDCGDELQACGKKAPCCNHSTCKIVRQSEMVICSDSSAVGECSKELRCDGRMETCPVTEPGRLCANLTKACTTEGMCEGHLCQHFPGFNPCECRDRWDQCRVCCQNGTDADTCSLLSSLEESARHSHRILIPVALPEGTPCGWRGERRGTCDHSLGACRFKSSASTTCGDGILDPRIGEECDCRLEEETCEWLMPCCNHTTCRFIDEQQMVTCFPSGVTNEEDECQRESICDGRGELCPTNFRSGRFCANGTKTCTIDGRCTGHVCEHFEGMTGCNCAGIREQCKVCCQLRNDEDSCRPVEELLHEREQNVVKTRFPDGVACGRPNMRDGRCDEALGLCRFYSSDSVTCGDGVVDNSLGEECDCPEHTVACTAKEPCCDHRLCRFIPLDQRQRCHASTEEECLKDIVCNGTGILCPIPDTTSLCGGGNNTCTPEGKCEGPVCLHFGLQECSCLEPEYMCHVCCHNTSEDVGNRPCRPLLEIVEAANPEALRLPVVRTFKWDGASCGWRGRREGVCVEDVGLCHFFSSKSTTCGDGYVNESQGEECDCPYDERTCNLRMPCCDFVTCKWSRDPKNAQCQNNVVKECIRHLQDKDDQTIFEVLRVPGAGLRLHPCYSRVAVFVTAVQLVRQLLEICSLHRQQIISVHLC